MEEKAKENAVLKIQVKIHSGHLTVHTQRWVKTGDSAPYRRQINLFPDALPKMLAPNPAGQAKLPALPDRLSVYGSQVSTLFAVTGATDAATAASVSFEYSPFSGLKLPGRQY